jgi:hypothetical protein
VRAERERDALLEQARAYLGLPPETLQSEGWLPAMHTDNVGLYLGRKAAALESGRGDNAPLAQARGSFSNRPSRVPPRQTFLLGEVLEYLFRGPNPRAWPACAEKWRLGACQRLPPSLASK